MSIAGINGWAPTATPTEAPTPITAFLSVGSKAASFAMLLRIFIEGLPSMSADWRLLFEVLAIVTMTVGNVAALTQTNLKRMLAYSSIAHAGYLLMGVVAGTPRGVSAMLIYLLIYAFMQLGAFAVIVDLGRWWEIWRVPIYFWRWSGSPQLEVALCIMAYVFVLMIEASPARFVMWPVVGPAREADLAPSLY